MIVHYCSSDLYTGTRESSEETGNYFFHGRFIVQAAIEDITKHVVPDLGNLQQVVLMGESAGGYGVGFNCDLVSSRFHEEMPDLDVRCVADAGDFYPPYMSSTEDCDVLTFMSQLALFYHSEGDASCFSGAWGPDNTELECLSFMTSYHEITTPFMVVNHYMDTVVHGWCTPGLNDDPAFWATWEEEVKAMALRFVNDKPGEKLVNQHRRNLQPNHIKFPNCKSMDKFTTRQWIVSLQLPLSCLCRPRMGMGSNARGFAQQSRREKGEKNIINNCKKQKSDNK